MTWRYTWTKASDGWVELHHPTGRLAALVSPETDTPEYRRKVLTELCRRYNPRMRRLFPRSRYGQHVTYA
jgi:hypothetical protein